MRDSAVIGHADVTLIVTVSSERDLLVVISLAEPGIEGKNSGRIGT